MKKFLQTPLGESLGLVVAALLFLLLLPLWLLLFGLWLVYELIRLWWVGDEPPPKRRRY